MADKPIDETADIRIRSVKRGKARKDRSGAVFVVETEGPDAVISIDDEALIQFGGTCLHAVTNAPLGPTTAISVAKVQLRLIGMVAHFGFTMASGHTYWFKIEGEPRQQLARALALAPHATQQSCQMRRH